MRTEKEPQKRFIAGLLQDCLQKSRIKLKRSGIAPAGRCKIEPTTVSDTTISSTVPSGPDEARQAVVLPFPARRRVPDSLPIVDLDGLDDPNPAVQRSAAGRIGEIAMENGFLYIRSHGVSSQLIEAVYEQARCFFAQDAGFKGRYYIGHSPNHRGYVPVTEKGDYADEQGPRRYEAFDMGVDLPADDPDFLAGNPLLGPNVWPDQPGFRYILGRYFREVQRIGMTMCRAFEMALELPKGYFRQQMTKPISQLRLLHYLANERPESAMDVNMGAHTDYECFTILHSRSPALQILDLNSNWVDAPPIDNTFYFNIGDMLEAWSGGLLVATAHRVANRGDERFSMPYFQATNFDSVVSPVHCAKFADKQADYPPVVAGAHLLSQLLRDFPYMRRRYEAGLLRVPRLQPGPNPFESRISQNM